MEKKFSLWVSVGTAALAFVGALAGTFLAGYMQENLWERQSSHEERRLILNQRVELIERASVIVNKAPIADSLNDYAVLQAEIAKLNADCVKTDEKGGLDQSQCFPQESLIENMKFINGRADLNAEFASTIQLVSIYFGPKTRKAAEEYANTASWWEADSKYSRALIAAMQDELAYFEE